MQQRPLMFMDIPCPHEAVWAQLSDAHRTAVIEVLARLIAQTTTPDESVRENSHD